MAEEKTLPGWPRKSLVKATKQCLWRYLRSRPTQYDECWRAAWEWAKATADRSLMFQFGKVRRAKWPHGNEIATQYLLLALSRMKGDHNLRLPFRSEQCMTPRVIAMLSSAAPLPNLSLISAKPHGVLSTRTRRSTWKALRDGSVCKGEARVK